MPNAEGSAADHCAVVGWTDAATGWTGFVVDHGKSDRLLAPTRRTGHWRTQQFFNVCFDDAIANVSVQLLASLVEDECGTALNHHYLLGTVVRFQVSVGCPLSMVS